MHEALEKLSENASDRLSKTAMPEWTEPMLATLTHEYFSDPAWIFERKLDGQRCLFFKQGNNIRLMSRNQKNQNDYYPEIVDALKSLRGDFIVDGELVTFVDRLTSFSALQNRMHVSNPGEKLLKDYPVFAYIFDLIYFDGYDLTHVTLKDRKSVLKTAFDISDPLVYLAHKNEKGEKYLEDACERGWEGLIAKDSNSTYAHSRSTKWLKFKCAKGQEFVIGGYTAPKGERIGFGALLIGYYDKGQFLYAGKVGTGYDDNFLKDFWRRMDAHMRKTSPFDNFDESEDGITWLTPHFVGEVGFTEWTNGGKLRHPRFLGLRKDKAPGDVVREDKRAA